MNDSPSVPQVALSPSAQPGLVEGAGSALVEARLAESQARVAQLQGELERLRHTIGHDLRAPLRHITGFVQVVQEDHGRTLPVEAQQHLETIATAAAQMRGLVDSLLKY